MLSTLPCELSDCSALQEINLENNLRLVNPPPDVYLLGSGNVLEHLKRQICERRTFHQTWNSFSRFTLFIFRFFRFLLLLFCFELPSYGFAAGSTSDLQSMSMSFAASVSTVRSIPNEFPLLAFFKCHSLLAIAISCEKCALCLLPVLSFARVT